MLLSVARAALLAALLTSAVAAQGGSNEQGGGIDPAHGAAGTGTWSLRLGFYDRPDDGEGNPFLDQELTVIEPIVVFDYNVSDSFGYNVQFTYDNVSSASIQRLSAFPDQSGASGDYYFGLRTAFRHKQSEDVWVGWHIGAATEYDYQSLGFGGNVAVDSADRNSSWLFSVDGFLDQIDVIRFDGSEEGSDDRLSLAGTVRNQRVLGPRTTGNLGLTVSSQSGFLETAYNAVVLEDPSLPPNGNLANNARGIETTEELPNSRVRTALYGNVRHLLRPGTAVEMGGRLYTDTWGISSVAVEPRVYQSLSENVLLRARYRYYVQTAADDFRDHFLLADPLPAERTQDSELADFNSNTVGAKLIWQTGKGHSWDISFDYVFRSDGLDHLLLAFGWTRSF